MNALRNNVFDPYYERYEKWVGKIAVWEEVVYNL